MTNMNSSVHAGARMAASISTDEALVLVETLETATTHSVQKRRAAAVIRSVVTERDEACQKVNELQVTRHLAAKNEGQTGTSLMRVEERVRKLDAKIESLEKARKHWAAQLWSHSPDTVAVPVGVLNHLKDIAQKNSSLDTARFLGELLAERKSTLPTIPGSVVRIGVLFFLTRNGWLDECGNKIVDGWMDDQAWNLVLDAGSTE